MPLPHASEMRGGGRDIKCLDEGVLRAASAFSSSCRAQCGRPAGTVGQRCTRSARGVAAWSFRFAVPSTVWRTTVGDTANEKLVTRRTILHASRHQCRAVVTSASCGSLSRSAIRCPPPLCRLPDRWQAVRALYPPLPVSSGYRPIPAADLRLRRSSLSRQGCDGALPGGRRATWAAA